MHERPPGVAAHFLAWALGSSKDARAVLGDLNEDFVVRLRGEGRVAAHRWYLRESIPLALSALAGRVVGIPIVRDTKGRREGIMKDRLSRSGWVQDAAYAFRAIRRDRGFFVFATLIIGLGVGASTAVFSVMKPLLLQPLPFDDPGQLVLIENGFPEGGLSGVTSRTSNLRDFRARSRSFDGIAGYNAFFDQNGYNLSGDDPTRLVGVNVTSDFLDVLGVSPVAGRGFLEEEGYWGGFVDQDGGPRAIILTHGFWIRHFGGDLSMIGRPLTLNDEPVTVVGVLPETFDFSSIFTPTTPVDFLLPWPVSDGTDNWGNTTTMVARLRPGVGIEAAQADLEAVIAGLQEAEPDRRGLAAATSGLQERIARPFRSGMLLLGAAAGLVMLIACVNLSNMLLARSPRRRREMAVRRTLGATRQRLVRQLLIESVMVSMAGALVGVLLAAGATRFVSTRAGLDIPMLSSISVDSVALMFTATIALLAGVAVGAVPAFQVSEGGEAEALGGSARGSGRSRGARRFREVLVVTEVAMACVLLIFGGLVLKSFQQVMEVDVGFEAERAVAWQLSSARDFQTLEEAIALYDEIAVNVEAVPGVQGVGLVDVLPLGTNRTWSTRVVDKEYVDDQGEPFFPHIVDARYLPTMGIPLVEGRYFNTNDTQESPMVVVVNETAARSMFDGDALGRSIQWNESEVEVIGVVGDVKHRSLEFEADNEIYFSMAQLWAFQTVDMVVRTDLPAASIAAAVASAVHSVESQMPTEDYRTLDSLVESSVSPRRFTLQLLVAFALCALLLAAVGIYGVLSYSVTERIPEIGIRMALGESAESVRRTVVGQTLLLATIGVLLGTLGSLVSTRLLASLLFGVAPTDPLIFGGMVTLLLAVAFISGLIPAIRASRADPAGALRSAA